MLQEELTFELLSKETGIAYEQIPKLWNAFLLQVEQRLGSTSCIDLSPLGFWSLKLSDEYIAELEGGEAFIVSPRLCLHISSEAINEAGAIYSLEDCLEGLKLETKLSEQTSKTFLNHLTELINKELEAKNDFYCPNLGVLSPSINEEGAVLGYKLSLEKAFAETLNKPFAMFNPIELQGLNKDEAKLEVRAISSLDEIELPLGCYYKKDAELMEQEINNNLDLGAVEEAELIAPATENEDLPLEEEQEELPKGTETLDLGIIEEDEEQKKQAKRSKRPSGFYFFIIVLVLGLSYLFLLFYQKHQKIAKAQIKQEQLVQIKRKQRLDSLEQVKRDSLILQKKQEEPSEEIEIRSGHTLRRIALKKYGHKVFWIYIYEENKAIIPDPNNVAIGTKLRLAPNSKYDIDPNDTNSIKRALELEHRFYNQSKKQ